MVFTRMARDNPSVHNIFYNTIIIINAIVEYNKARWLPHANKEYVNISLPIKFAKDIIINCRNLAAITMYVTEWCEKACFITQWFTRR